MILACQKLLGQITKVLGLRRPPPPPVGKNSQIFPYFFFKSPHSLVGILTREAFQELAKHREKEVFVLAQGSWDPPSGEKWWQRSKYHLALAMPSANSVPPP